MTASQLSDVLEWKYPDAQYGKAYSVQNGQLVFNLWLDRATGLPSAEPQPTYAQCEAWLPDLPASYFTAQKEAVAAYQYDIVKLIKAVTLVTMDEINLIRGSSAATISGMSDRTEAQVRTAVIDKYKSL